MDWLFVPLGNFFTWTFNNLIVPAGEGIGGRRELNFNAFIMVVGTILCIYWFQQIMKHRKNDKGLFKKS